MAERGAGSERERLPGPAFREQDDSERGRYDGGLKAECESEPEKETGEEEVP